VDCGPIGAASPTSGPQTTGPRPFWHNALVVAAMQACATVVPQMQAENTKNGKILTKEAKQANEHRRLTESATRTFK